MIIEDVILCFEKNFWFKMFTIILNETRGIVTSVAISFIKKFSQFTIY